MLLNLALLGLSTLALSTLASAQPLMDARGGHGNPSTLLKCQTDLDFTKAFTAGNATLPLPTGRLVAATVARGVQNYTCTDGKYVSTGALASLYDMTCLVAAADQIAILNPAVVAGAIVPGSLEHKFNLLAPKAVIHHEFVAFNGSVAPFFIDKAHPKSVTLRKVADIPSPDAAIPWLYLQPVAGVESALASEVYRTSTAGGVPPPACDGGDLAVDYAALYYFFK